MCFLNIQTDPKYGVELEKITCQKKIFKRYLPRQGALLSRLLLEEITTRHVSCPLCLWNCAREQKRDGDDEICASKILSPEYV